MAARDGHCPTPTACTASRALVASNTLSRLSGQLLVVVLGLFGTGKSTAIAVQNGATFAFDEDGDLALRAAAPVAMPRISSNTTTSQTLHIKE